MNRAISILDIAVGSTPDESLALGLQQAVANVASEVDASLNSLDGSSYDR